MKYLHFVLLLLIASRLQAQQYLIRYNLLNHQSSYFKIVARDTIAVKKVELPASGQLLLQVENYNPFYWNARVSTVTNSTDNLESFTDAFNPFSVLAGGFGELMTGLPSMDLPRSRGLPDKAELDDVSYRFVTTVNRYSVLYESVQKLNDKLLHLQVAKLKLQELKMNNALQGPEMKMAAHVIMKTVLLTDTPDIETILVLGRKTDNEYSALLHEAVLLAGQIRSMRSLVDPATEFDGQTFGELGDRVVTGFSAIEKMNEEEQRRPHVYTDEVTTVINLYREIAAASFIFSYALEFNDAVSAVKLQLYSKNEAAGQTADTMVQYFDVNRKKGMRIRNSLGVAFTYFNANNRTYIIDNGVLKTGAKDLFTPLLSTYIHFYAAQNRSFKWGGAFGFGIPLQGEKKEINFMLGLTAVLGRNDAIMLSAGIAGAKVTKLLGDYKPGDNTTETDIAKITTTGYSAGGFMGLSLNLSSLLKAK